MCNRKLEGTMEEQNPENSNTPIQDEAPARAESPTRYHRPHISQEPIDDAEPEYVTRNRYQTLEESRAGRKHMGVASGDPVYLKDAPLSPNSQPGDDQTPAPINRTHRGPRPKQTLTYSARYLETPKQGKTIFVSSDRRRKQHRIQIALIIIAIAAIAMVLKFVVFH